MDQRFLKLGLVAMLAVSLSACGGATATPTSAPATDAPVEEAVPTEAEITETIEAEAPATDEATEAAVESAVTDEAAATYEATESGAEETATNEATTETTTETVASGATALVTFANSARSGPGTSFAEVGALAVGDTVAVLAKSDESSSAWYLVSLDSGENAWVWSRVVRINPSDAEVEIAATVPAP